MKRTPTKHIIQIAAPDWELIRDGNKGYNNQPDDKKILVGDTIHIYELSAEVDGKPGHVTGNSCLRRVKRKEVGTEALSPGFCTLEIGRL